MHHQTDAGLRCLSAHVRQTCTQAQTHMCACVYTGWKRNQNVQLSLLCKIQYPQNAGSHIHMITLRGLGLSKSPAWGCVCVGGGLPLIPTTNTACMAATVCVCVRACVYKHRNVFARIREAPLWHNKAIIYPLIGMKATALDLHYAVAPIKTKRRHFLPISLMNIKDEAAPAPLPQQHIRKNYSPIILFALPVIGTILGAVFIALSAAAWL